jgi:hypothetical protein
MADNASAPFSKLSTPRALDDLRRVLIRGKSDRHAISSRLMRNRDQNGQDWADIIGLPDDVAGCAAAGRPGAWRAIRIWMRRGRPIAFDLLAVRERMVWVPSCFAVRP